MSQLQSGNDVAFISHPKAATNSKAQRGHPNCQLSYKLISNNANHSICGYRLHLRKGHRITYYIIFSVSPWSFALDEAMPYQHLPLDILMLVT